MFFPLVSFLLARVFLTVVWMRPVTSSVILSLMDCPMLHLFLLQATLCAQHVSGLFFGCPNMLFLVCLIRTLEFSPIFLPLNLVILMSHGWAHKLGRLMVASQARATAKRKREGIRFLPSSTTLRRRWQILLTFLARKLLPPFALQRVVLSDLNVFAIFILSRLFHSMGSPWKVRG